MRRNNSIGRLSVNFLLWLALLAAIFLAGCQTTPSKNEVKQAAKPAPVAQGSQPKRAPADNARAIMEAKLLSEAENAFRAGRLTSPEHDNAYDRFQSVLMLNPANTMARSGVQAILLSYAERIRNAVKSGRSGSAQSLLRQAELYYPANPLLMGLKKEIAQARAREEETLLAHSPENNARMEYPLPRGALSRKSPVVSDYLGRIARRLRETSESVMIYARNDAEGRWIYRELKRAVPGYRIRGDIKIGRSPKITVLPPLQ